MGDGASARVFCNVRGTLTNPEWSLILKKDSYIEPTWGPDKEFRLDVPLRTAETQLLMLLVNPRGNVEQVTITLSFAAWPSLQEYLALVPYSARLFVGVGPNFLIFTEGTLPTLQQPGLAVRALWDQRIGGAESRWSVLGQVDGGAIPFARGSGTQNAWPLEISVRGTYAPPWPRGAWSGRFELGGHYSMLFVPGNAFGYNNFTGPTVALRVQRQFTKRHAARVETKYSARTDIRALLNLEDHEFAFGVSWLYTLKNGHPLQVLTEVSRLQLLKDFSQTLNFTSFSTPVPMLAWTGRVTVSYGIY